MEKVWEELKKELEARKARPVSDEELERHSAGHQSIENTDKRLKREQELKNN